MMFEYTIGLFAVLALIVIGWALWLDHCTEWRLIDILDAAVKAGQTPPPELVARFSGEREAGPIRALSRRTVVRIAALFIAVGMAAFLASAFAAKREQEQGFLFVAAVAALIAILLYAFYAFGRRRDA
jgi:hypothetical protein